MKHNERDTLATDILVTFDKDEMDTFFEGFTSIEDIVRSLFEPLGNPLE